MVLLILRMTKRSFEVFAIEYKPSQLGLTLGMLKFTCYWTGLIGVCDMAFIGFKLVCIGNLLCDCYQCNAIIV